MFAVVAYSLNVRLYAGNWIDKDMVSYRYFVQTWDIKFCFTFPLRD
jgi:hypothetical protein